MQIITSIQEEFTSQCPQSSQIKGVRNLKANIAFQLKFKNSKCLNVNDNTDRQIYKASCLMKILPITDNKRLCHEQ